MKTLEELSEERLCENCGKVYWAWKAQKYIVCNWCWFNQLNEDYEWTS